MSDFQRPVLAGGFGSFVRVVRFDDETQGTAGHPWGGKLSLLEDE
jgi:hypothetical protein